MEVCGGLEELEVAVVLREDWVFGTDDCVAHAGRNVFSDCLCRGFGGGCGGGVVGGISGGGGVGVGVVGVVEVELSGFNVGNRARAEAGGELQDEGTRDRTNGVKGGVKAGEVAGVGGHDDVREALLAFLGLLFTFGEGCVGMHDVAGAVEK